MFDFNANIVPLYIKCFIIYLVFIIINFHIKDCIIIIIILFKGYSAVDGFLCNFKSSL